MQHTGVWLASVCCSLPFFCIYLYADDAKLFSHVKCEEDSFRLQKDIDSVIQWMEMWLLRLNTTKCKAMTYGRGPGICTSYSISSDAVEKI